MLVLFLFMLAAHEWVHGLVMSRFGAHPEYGAGLRLDGAFAPHLYCTAPGYKFTRRQYALVSLAPATVISLAGTVLAIVVPYGYLLISPLAFHLGGCIGDLWFLGVVFRQPPRTLFEDMKTAVRMHHPAI